MKTPTTGEFLLPRLALAALLLLPGALKSQAGSFHLSASDSAGSSSFNTSLHFTNDATGAAGAPSAGNDYAVSTAPNLVLRSPTASQNYTFAGNSLTLSNGGTLYFKNASGGTLTINNLTNSGMITEAINPNTSAGLAGTMAVVGVGALYTGSTPTTPDIRSITNATTMSGSGVLTNYGGGFIFFTGNNSAFTGPVSVGPCILTANTPTTLGVSSESNLGGNPAAFNAAQLLLDYGMFQALASFSLNNANSGITLNSGGGTFTNNSGITLTVAEPITGRGSLTKAGAGTLILTGSNSYTNGTAVSGGILNVQNSFGLGTNGGVNQASGARNSSIQLQGGVTIPAAVNFTLSNDGTGASPTTTNAIESISGNNTINGTITLTVGGGNAAIQSDSGALVINGNVRIAAGQSSRGVILQGVSTAANAVNGPIADLSPASVNSVTKNSTGAWTLSGTNTYSGLTLINGGTLLLSGSGSISNTPLISIASGATFDVSGLSSTFTLGAGQSISNSLGTVNGPVAAAAGATIYPATVGVAGTLTFNNNLNLAAGGTVYFDLSPSAASGNDQIVVGGNLTLSSSDYVHINAMSGILDTSDYVLFSVGTGTTLSTTPVLVWDGSVPSNYLNYSLVQVGNNVVLRFSASTAPSVTASANPASAARNQAVTVTANVTQGSGTIVSVTVDLTQIGGSATAALALDSADSTPPTYIYTNTFLVSAGTSLGNKSLTVTATDNSSPTPLTGTYVITPFAITANAVTWDGGATDNKWISNTNWTSDIGPGFIGDSVTFSGTTQLFPDMSTNYSVASVTFDDTAGTFTLGSSTGSTLTDSGGVTNNSVNLEIVDVPVTLTAAQTFNAVSGNLTFNTNINLGAYTLTVASTANTVINGVISGTGVVTNSGSGTLTLATANTFSGGMNLVGGGLVIGNDAALGTGLFDMADGVTIQSADSSPHIITNRLNFGSGAGGNNIFTGTGNLKFTGSAANGSAKTLTVNNPQTEFSGVLSGAMARTVAGTGLLVFSGADTYTAGTTINSGATLQLGNGGTNGSLSTSGAIDDEGTLIINRSNAVVQGVDFSSSPIGGGGGFTQAGSGTTTLNLANTYSGLTAVNNGELFITPAYQQGGNVSVADGAKFGISASSVTNSAIIGNLTLGSSLGGTTLDLSYGLVGNPTNAALVANAVSITGTSAIRIGGSFTVGTFPILKYSSLSGTFNSQVTGPRGVTATVYNDTVNQVIDVVVSSVGGGIVWTGTNGVSPNLWDINTTTNWLIGGLPTVYLESVPPGDAVTFNDQGSSLVLLSNTVNPASVTISNRLVNYTIQGSGQINSAAGLNKVGTGTVTMNVPGIFSGSTVLSNGMFSFGANQTLANLSGNSAVTLSTGTPTLTVNNTLNTTYSGSVSVANLTLTGGGQLTLTAANSLSGNLFVSSGTLTLPFGTMSLNNYASIGHTGTDNGILNLQGAASVNDTSDFNVGDTGAAVGTFNIQDTASLTANAFYVGSANATGSSASGTVNQTGGAVTELSTTAGTFSIGGRAATTSVGGVGTYNLIGGTLTAASPIRVGGAGEGTFEQSNGLVTASAGVDIASIAGSSGTYYLDGGTLQTLNVLSSSVGNATLNLNGGRLIPLGNNLAFVTNVAQINVRNGGAIVDTTNFIVTISPPLQHSDIGGDNAIDGGLTKRGNGTLSLIGAGSSYTGPTVVTAGALSLAAGSVPYLNNVTVNNSTLGLALNGGASSFSATSLALTGNSTLNLNYNLISGTPGTAIIDTGSLTASGTTTINVFGYGWTPAQLTLVGYTGAPLANLNNFALGALPYGVAATLSNNVANMSIDLVVTSVSIANWIPLVATDPITTSSFNAAGDWQDGNPPTPGNGYLTESFTLRSPADTNAYTFDGSALSIDSGGRFLMKGTNGQVITVNNLIMNGGLVDYANTGDSFTETLAGSILLQGGVTSYMGALSAGGSETLFENAPISGSGSLQIGGSTVNAGQDTGAVVFDATNTYTGATTVAGGTLLVNGVIVSSAITVGNGATLGGSGRVGGTVTVQTGGTLAPGTPTKGALVNAIGTLTSTGAASVSGAVAMKINDATAPNSDEFVATAVTVNPGATLTVADIGTNLVAGDTFRLFSTPISGSFSTVTLPALSGKGLYWTNNLAVNGSIAVAASVNTNPTNIVATVNAGTLTLAWPQDHTGWTLQVQTNSSSVGLGNNWVDVPGSTATNAVSIPISASSGAVFYRLKL